MTCAHCDAHLLELIHHELAAELQGELLHHLAGCPGCAVSFCRLRADLEGVSASAEAPPASLRGRVRREVERAFRPPWWRRALAAWQRPVPAYGIVVASLAPMVAWAAISLGPGIFARPPAPASLPVPAAAPRILDYDAMIPLTPRDVLL